MTDSNASAVEPEEFWANLRDQGYDGMDIMDAARAFGWQPVPCWGRDGWDLCEWPYYYAMHRDDALSGRSELVTYCEGDVVHQVFATRAERDSATDEVALFAWQHSSHEVWGIGLTVASMPAERRGPYGRVTHILANNAAKRVSS